MRLYPRSSPGVMVFLSLASMPALAQVPVITSGGVLNAASGSSPVAPGGLVAIFGTNLATTQRSASPPLPTTLGGTSVTMGGIPAPISFVSPTQINAQAPSSLTADSSITATPVVVTTQAGSSAPALSGLTSGAPGLFSADGSGCGQAAALNIRPDGTVSLNSSSNSAAPGDYVALFGTGFGLATRQPPDGAASGASALQSVPELTLDGNPVSSLLYAGLAPSLAGVDQINFQVPASTRNGCSVPVAASQILGSPTVTISVKSGRGQCSDPPIQSWGSIYLYKWVFSGPGATGIQTIESFIASFPSGPGVQPPAPDPIVFAPQWIAGVPVQARLVLSALPQPLDLRTCPVPGYSHLSAGAIQIQPPSGSVVTAQPQPLQSEGVYYGQSLPAGFIARGTYKISGTQGSAVGLTAGLVVGSPIQLQTSFPPGTVVSSSKPLTVQWTGGDPGTLVKVSLISQQGSTVAEDYSYADAAAGSLIMAPACTQNPAAFSCSFGLPLSSTAQITVQVLPAPDHVTTISVPGVTDPVPLAWQYSYSFSGLVLGQ